MTVAEDLVVDVQLAVGEKSVIDIPSSEKIQQWVVAALSAVPDKMNAASGQGKTHDTQITVRIVEEAEISQLNETFRHKAGATNVLSFPFVSPPGIPADESIHSLGDLVVCAPVVDKEAREQHKLGFSHWAHMVVHGALHLLGYDHQSKEEAYEMESLEKEIMSELGFVDPYKEV